MSLPIPLRAAGWTRPAPPSRVLAIDNRSLSPLVFAAAFGAILVVVLALLWPMLGKPYVYDEVSFAQMAEGIVREGVPRANVAPFVPRVTLTLPTLASCHEMLFEVSGRDKRAILTRLFAGESLPANRARSTGETVWLVDRQALPEDFGGQ